MTRLRIQIPGSTPFGSDANGVRGVRIADFCDTKITLVADDGSEHDINNVSRIDLRIGDGNGPPTSTETRYAVATLTFFDVELDAEIVVDAKTEADIRAKANK